MKHKLYIKMKVNGVATAIPETIKVSDNDLSKSLTGHKSRSETKREVINTTLYLIPTDDSFEKYGLVIRNHFR